MNSNNFFARLFWNYVYSGHEWNPAQSRQVSFINTFSIIGIFSAVGFGIYRILGGEPVSGGIEIIIGVLGFLNILYLRKSFDTEAAGGFLLFIMMGMLAFLFVDGGVQETGLFWIFTFPILSLFLFDDKVGLLWNLCLILILAAISMAKFAGLIVTPFEWVALRQAFFSFVAVTSLLYFYMKFTGINARILAERTQKMESTFEKEKDQIEARAKSEEMALKEKLSSFFETAGGLMGIMSPEGYFIEVNPSFLKILGYSQEELLKNNLTMLLHPDDAEKSLKALEKLLAGTPLENYTIRFKKKDGEYIWLMWNATFHEGFIYAMGNVIQDIVNTQKQLESKLAELEKLNRLMVDRELTMIQMKKELAALKKETK